MALWRPDFPGRFWRPLAADCTRAPANFICRQGRSRLHQLLVKGLPVITEEDIKNISFIALEDIIKIQKNIWQIDLLSYSSNIQQKSNNLWICSKDWKKLNVLSIEECTLFEKNKWMPSFLLCDVPYKIVSKISWWRKWFTMGWNLKKIFISGDLRIE